MTLAVELSPVATSVREGRRFVLDALVSWGLDDLADTAALLTSELLTNSVLHARTAIALSVRQVDEATVEICVRDGSRHAPRRRGHAHDATTGRGIELLEKLAQSWDVTTDETGKTVRFLLAAGEDPWSVVQSDLHPGRRAVSQERPLGRYSPDEDPQAPSGLHEVTLVGVPVQLFLAARERHDELLREFSLLALSDEPRRADLPGRFLELIEILGVRYAGASDRPDRAIEQAASEGQPTVDLPYSVPAAVVEAAAELEHWLVMADEFCAAERLLTLPRGPAFKQLAGWYFDEFRRQVGGAPPQPWDGPLSLDD